MSAIKVISSKTLYKNHGKGIGYWTIELVELVNGDAGGIIRHAKGKGCKEVSSSFTSSPKNVGKANETTALQQAESEVESRINKQLDKGYVRTEAEADLPATNAIGKKLPMLALDIKKVDTAKIDWENAYVQPKLDGHRALFHDGVLYSRNGKPINLPHIIEAIKAAGLSGLHLDGELYCHGKSLQLIGSLVKKPAAESLEIEYHIYDMVLNIPFVQRHVMLAGAMQRAPFQVLSAELPSPLKLVSTVRVDSEEGRLAMHRQYIAQGYEGSMLRQGTEGYQDGKRPNQLLKGKDMEDHEYRVVGYERGAARVARDEEGNEVSRLEVPVWVLDVGDGRTFKATAAGDATEKNKQWTDREKHVGRLLTVRHFGFTPDGIPDLPVAKAWKDDL